MSEFKKAFAADCDVSCRTHIGGQALIEGVMMRGRYNWAVAVRQPDGEIYTEEHDLASGRKKNSWMYWPIIRGCTAFIESLMLGYKALSISSDHAFDWEAEDEAELAEAEAKDVEKAIKKAKRKGQDVQQAEAEVRAEYAAEREKRAAEQAKKQTDAALASAEQAEKEDGGMGVMMTISMILGTLLGIVIFVVAPAGISNLVFGEQAMNTAAWNIFDGVLRVAIFIAYIWLISLMKDIKRMFAYHGAEHLTIHCFEHGLELTPENAKQFPRLHVRCGTAFMIMVMIIAIFVYTVLGQPINALVDLTGVTEGPLRFVLVVLTRIILLPVIAGCSYEISVRWAGKRPNNPLVKVILWPGLQMQRLTTNPPDEGMLECAITAMKLVLAREEREAAQQADGEIEEVELDEAA